MSISRTLSCVSTLRIRQLCVTEIVNGVNLRTHHRRPKAVANSVRWMSSAPASNADNDSSLDWRKLFSGREYVHPWSDRLEPLDGDPILDRRSRFTLSVLQKLHETSLSQKGDKITTDRANNMIKRLSNMEESHSDSTGVARSTSMWQRAERGRAILEAMELLEHLRDTPKLPALLPLPNHETYWKLALESKSKNTDKSKSKRQGFTGATVSLCH